MVSSVFLNAPASLPARPPSNRRGGYYEIRSQEEVIDGQFVEVYHPPVYEEDENGRRLVQKESTTHEPKMPSVAMRIDMINTG